MRDNEDIPLCKRWQIRYEMAELGGASKELGVNIMFILCGRDSSFFLVFVHKILVPTEMGGCFIATRTNPGLFGVEVHHKLQQLAFLP